MGGVTRVYFSLAATDIEGGRFLLREKRPSLSLSELQAMKDAEFLIPAPIADLIVPEL